MIYRIKSKNKEDVTEEKTDRPEPPKDENGNPIAPPDGFKHGCCKEEKKAEQTVTEKETVEQ